MERPPLEIREGIFLFEGKVSRNLLIDPMVSHAYFIEDGGDAVLFDPSCGKPIGRRVEAFIQDRRRGSRVWRKAVLIAGHSHLDHANNFYLADSFGAAETHVYVHEYGFRNGRVLNEPAPFFKNMLRETKEYYNIYRSFFAPYNLLLAPLAALDRVSSRLAESVFAGLGSLPFPPPVNGTAGPEPLRENEKEEVWLGEVRTEGWPLGEMVILPTPGHSPCSVSLVWPRRKALFVSDADWIGNPVFVTSSLRDCISSLQRMKTLVEAGVVDLLLPAHGSVIEGEKEVLQHLDFQVRRLETLRDEVLALYRASGSRDIPGLTKTLVRRSPLFRMMKESNFPRFVCLVHNVVAVCLIEEGIV